MWWSRSAGCRVEIKKGEIWTTIYLFVCDMLGIYNQELPLQFVKVLCAISTERVSNIVTVLQQVYHVSDPTFMALYQQRLDIPASWCPITKRHEILAAITKHPCLPYIYEYTYYKVLQACLGSKNLRQAYDIPTLQDFIYLFITRAAVEPHIRSLKIYKLGIDQTLALFMGIVHSLLMECIQSVSLAEGATSSLRSALTCVEEPLEPSELTQQALVVESVTSPTVELAKLSEPVTTSSVELMEPTALVPPVDGAVVLIESKPLPLVQLTSSIEYDEELESGYEDLDESSILE